MIMHRLEASPVQEYNNQLPGYPNRTLTYRSWPLQLVGAAG